MHDHLALGGAVEAGDQVQQRRLARARRAHQRQELALVHREVEVDQHGDDELVAAVFLVHAAQLDRMLFAHRLLSLSVWATREAAPVTRAIRTTSLVAQRLDRIEDDRFAVLQARLDAGQVVVGDGDLDLPLAQ